jgi:site-specific DNA-methyltransferase (adenine-specific)
MVTDPPYGVEYEPAWRDEKLFDGAGIGALGKVKNDDRADWREVWRLFPGHVAYVWHAGLQAGIVSESLLAAGFKIRAQIVWVKQRPIISQGAYHWQHEPCFYAVRPDELGQFRDGWRFLEEQSVASYVVRDGAKAQWNGDRKQSSVWTIPAVKNTTGHGTQKPVECMRRPILNNSAPGQIVFDPFAGSGTTIIAAEQADRRCFGLEISPVYCDVAVKRWEEFTGSQARLDGAKEAKRAG